MLSKDKCFGIFAISAMICILLMLLKFETAVVQSQHTVTLIFLWLSAAIERK